MPTRVKLSKSSDVIKNLDKTTQNIFRVNSEAEELLGIGYVLFGSGSTYEVGIRSFQGTMQYRNSAGEWMDMGTGTGGSGSGCLKYATHKLGSSSDDHPVNSVYSLSNGTFRSDGSDLLVFVNGLQKTLLAGDYSILDSNSIQLVSPLSDSNRIDRGETNCIEFESSIEESPSASILLVSSLSAASDALCAFKSSFSLASDSNTSASNCSKKLACSLS